MGFVILTFEGQKSPVFALFSQEDDLKPKKRQILPEKCDFRQ